MTRIVPAVVLAAVLALVGAASLTRAADHGDAPGVRFDTRVDINDIYAFRSPQTPSNVVMLMTTNPLAGITAPNTFHPNADYEFLVDNNGNAVLDFRFRVSYSRPGEGGVQQIRLIAERGGNALFEANGFTGQTISLPGGGLMRANAIDDPFFFDLLAFRNRLSFCPNNTGVNFFRGLNVMGLVIEVPASTFEARNIGVWGRTTLESGVVDRMGRPAINTVFIPAARKDLFNQTPPVADRAVFRDDVINTLLSLGNSAGAAASLADFLLPDILTLDTTNSNGFPNGRRLADDVIDIELGLITNNAVMTDCVANDSTFRDTFPYWQGPNP